MLEVWLWLGAHDWSVLNNDFCVRTVHQPTNQPSTGFTWRSMASRDASNTNTNKHPKFMRKKNRNGHNMTREICHPTSSFTLCAHTLSACAVECAHALSYRCLYTNCLNLSKERSLAKKSSSSSSQTTTNQEKNCFEKLLFFCVSFCRRRRRRWKSGAEWCSLINGLLVLRGSSQAGRQSSKLSQDHFFFP